MSAAQMKEMKETAIQFLGVEEAEENMEIQENNNTKTEIIRSVATATTQTEAEDLLLRSQGSEENNAIITSVATQTEVVEASLRSEESNAKINTSVATQTETEEVSLGSLLGSTELRLAEQINQLRSVVEGNSGVLAQLLPLIQNIQQELKELRRDTNITPAPAVPLSPEKPAPSTQLVVVTPEKHGDQARDHTRSSWIRRRSTKKPLR